MALIVLDIGGTSIKYGLWQDEVLSGKGSIKTPGSWEEMKIALTALKDRLGTGRTIEGVAISAPGAVNQEKGIIEGASAVPYIHHFPIFTELKELFQCPVSIENDANCAGLAEIWKGAAKGLRNVLFVVIGSGIGGAIIVDGKIWHGKHLFGGEFGYMLLTDTHTFSDLGTAVSMAKRVAKRKNLPEDALSGKDVFDLAEQGDPIAQEEVDTFYHYLAQGIFNLQYSFDPEKIIIGGGVSSKEDLLPELMKHLEEIVKQVKIAPFVPEISISQFKNDANLIGAVYNFKLKWNL
ncbi:ROK family protein [Bacillus sp. FJAT-49736]|uniref:ROK family protein n=1 Tax=Bacillus sp. FJAT-49736 TaxID=2833582 RepID=UPI001BC92374|nr:ROK family protein [Bacillus sp. FJAT-49736]MBS4174469.1 ROK family protein [Bacillus sp. FJAT-49736]MBS4175826.1 ROK family protein [Bacillus sp. FJAT-49736]